MANRKKSKKLSALLSAILIVFSALGYIVFGKELEGLLRELDIVKISTLITAPVSEGEIEVHVIDVGQGDSILVRSGGGNILIDAGTGNSENDLRAYLDAMGVEAIDYFICSHPHDDHIGGAAMIVENYTIGTILMPDALSSAYCFTDLLEAIEKHEVNAEIPEAGSEYTLGDITLKILGPVAITDDLNNMSLIVKMTFGANAFLFTGDAEADAECMLLDTYGAEKLDCDFYKVGHHGSNTSSSVDFVDAMSPSIAAISCGADNEYGHPHREILDRLEKAGVETILRTDQMGTVILSCDGREISVKNE